MCCKLDGLTCLNAERAIHNYGWHSLKFDLIRIYPEIVKNDSFLFQLSKICLNIAIFPHVFKHHLNILLILTKFHIFDCWNFVWFDFYLILYFLFQSWNIFLNLAVKPSQFFLNHLFYVCHLSLTIKATAGIDFHIFKFMLYFSLKVNCLYSKS